MVQLYGLNSLRAFSMTAFFRSAIFRSAVRSDRVTSLLEPKAAKTRTSKSWHFRFLLTIELGRSHSTNGHPSYSKCIGSRL